MDQPQDEGYDDLRHRDREHSADDERSKSKRQVPEWEHCKKRHDDDEGGEPREEEKRDARLHYARPHRAPEGAASARPAATDHTADHTLTRRSECRGVNRLERLRCAMGVTGIEPVTSRV